MASWLSVVYWGHLLMCTTFLWAVTAGHAITTNAPSITHARESFLVSKDGEMLASMRIKREFGEGMKLRGGAAATYDSKDAEKFDQALWEIMSQHPDEIHFLNTVFNFLQRRTPCFNGPNALTNYKILIETLTHQRETYKKHIEKGTKLAPHKPMPPKPKTEPAAPRPKDVISERQMPSASSPPVQKQKKPKHLMTEKELVEDSSTSHDEGRCATNEEQTGEDQAVMDARSEYEKKEEAKVKARSEGYGQTPVNNGGTTDRYVWTQSLKELSVEVWLPKGTRAKELSVITKARHLDVRTKGSDTAILSGELEEEILPDQTVWTMEDNVLTLTLAKAGDMTWWKTVMKGDPIINLKKVEPENSQLNDLDPDLKQTVEKMMYDQKMKAMGKPTLDQQKNKDMIDKFMKSHPEMDFSKCNFG